MAEISSLENLSVCCSSLEMSLSFMLGSNIFFLNSSVFDMSLFEFKIPLITPEEMFEIDNQFIIDPDIKIKESSLLQLLKKVLNKKEYLYLINSTLKGLSQSDIAKQYNVSQPYVNKVLSSAIKKSKKDKRIKLFWES